MASMDLEVFDKFSASVHESDAVLGLSCLDKNYKKSKIPQVFSLDYLRAE